MIYYFSGTGNSKWIAEEMAKKLQDKAVNIVDIKNEESIIAKDNETLGFVFPIYAWAPTEAMMNFIKRVKIKEDTFTFAIATCSSEAGDLKGVISKILPMNSLYSIAMPSNYIIGSDIDSKEVVDKKLKEAKIRIEDISKEVVEKLEVTKVVKGTLSFVKSYLVAPAFNKNARTAKKFTVDEKCTSCGLCEKLCPTKNIEIFNGKPSWGDKCYQCLSCINRCPKVAIQYGDKTKKRGRYYFKEK